jgi:dihydrofolate reductase
MRRVTVFNAVTLDGYFTDAKGDMSWAHKDDPEWNAFAAENAQGEGELLFGRVTYDLMAGYWPTPRAIETAPVLAQRMNSLKKVVFSRTLDRAPWNNTRLVKGDPATEVRRMKQEPGNDMVILGSGSIVAQLAQAGLIDEYQLALNPIVLGKGRTLFDGVSQRLPLKLTKSRVFGNGNVFLCYQPMA